MKQLSIKIFLVCLLFYCMQACGYRFFGKGKEIKIPDNARTLYIPMAKNNTQEPGLEETLSRIIVEEFIVDKRMPLVSKEEADISLQFIITSYNPEIPLAFDAENKPIEYRLRFSNELNCNDLREGVVLWEEKNIEVESEYDVYDNITISKSMEAEAYRKGSLELIQRIINTILED